MDYKELFEQMKAWENAHETRKKKFWEEDYPKMTFEDKIIYWRKDVYSAMQWQEEQKADPYQAFSKDWMDYHLAIEPDFEKILAVIVEKLSIDKTKLNKYITK